MTGIVMLLIDADNVSIDVMEQAVHLLVSEHGALHVRRAYCTAESAMKHQATFKRLGIRPMVNLAAGKNSTDIAMAIDALDLAIAERPAVAVIASSDSDFAPLVTKLREKGCRVVGIGQEGKTGDETRAVYDSFTVLAHRGGRSGDGAAARPSRAARPARPARKAASRSRPAAPAPAPASAAVAPAATTPPPPVPAPAARAAATGERKGLPPPPRRRGRGGRAAAASTDMPAVALAVEVPVDPPPAPLEPSPTVVESLPEEAAPAAARPAAKKSARAAARKTPRRKAAETPAAEADAPSPPPRPAAGPAPAPKQAAAAAPSGPSPAEVDRALAILKAVPGLADGATVELGVAAERLREAGLLGRGGSSTRLFGQFPTLFELRPAARPNHVRLRDGALD